MEQGGLFYANNRWAKACNAELDANKKHLIIHNDNFNHSRCDQVFAVEKDRFVFKDYLTNGKPMPPDNPFKYLLEVNAD